MKTKTIITALGFVLALYIVYRLIKNYNDNKRKIFEQQDAGEVDRVGLTDTNQQPTVFYSSAPRFIRKPPKSPESTSPAETLPPKSM